MPVRAAACVLASCATLASGCGGGDEPAATTAAPVTTATSEPTSIDALEGASDQPVVEPAANSETALLTAVRAARHEGYDRVVFEFANAVPGYDIRYARGPVRADGSGARVDVAGGQVVVVRLENALDADLSTPEARMTYTGPQRFAPGTPQVAELARVGGFEGVLTWAVGLTDRVEYRVTTLHGPPRLVIDFRNR